MKRVFTLFAAIMAVAFVMGQSVTRNMVILEISTGTWCTYCPGAANGADQLISEGKSVAVIEYHNNDAFVNAASNARNNYYGVTAYPTANFDGTVPYVGGQACPSGNVYGSYLPLYNQCIASPSLLTLCMSGSAVGNNYTVNVMVKKIGTITSTNLRLHLVLTESNIATAPWPGASGCMTEVNFVERLMVPDQNGTSFTFGSGNVQTFTLNFTKDPAWVTSECELVAFVQDNSTKQIFNGIKSPLSTLPSTMMTLTDFTGTPTMGCTPLNVNYTSAAAGVTTYSWSFPGGTPSSSTSANPSNIAYSTAGTYGAGLKVSNGVCKDSLGKTNYINVNGSPGTAATPTGNASMCVSPPQQVYTTTGATNATTYTWDLQPSGAGTMIPGGLTCAVNFTPGWTGTAQLKVQGSSSCGAGPWSPALSITVNSIPAKPGTPSGPSTVCENTLSTNFTTSGSPGATSYMWELTPSGAGTIQGSGLTATLYWNTGYTGTADIKVSAFTGSCQGPWSDPFSVTVNPVPPLHNITGGGAYCAAGSTGVEIGLDGSETGNDYTLYVNGSTTSIVVPGNGSAISFGNQTAAGIYAVIATAVSSGNCTSTMNGEAYVTIDPQVPDVPAAPTGPGLPNAGTSTDYVTTGGTYATSYAWSVDPTSAGTPSGNTTTGTIAWNTSYIGPASVRVQGVNTCGSSAVSASFNVTVLPPVGIPEKITCPNLMIYPNPAKSFINIYSPKKVQATIKVFNSLGTELIVLRELTLTTEYQLDISGLSRGVYFISVSCPEFREISKLIVE